MIRTAGVRASSFQRLAIQKSDRLSAHRRNNLDAHNPFNHLDSASDRSLAGVAIQHRLGLLSKRWTWIDPSHRNNPRRDGEALELDQIA